MAWTFYRSTDGSAPVLSGTAGALTNLLDAVLVNGYGAKAAAGWSIKHTATNKRCYRMGAAALSRMDVVIADDAISPASAQDAYMLGWEDCTGLTGTGTGTMTWYNNLSFGGGYIRKSDTANGTARSWFCVADERTFIFYADTGATGISWGVYFGEIYSFLDGDQYGVASVPRSGTGTSQAVQKLSYYNGFGGATATGIFIPRNEYQVYLTAGGIDCAAIGSVFGNSGGIPGILTFPDPVNSSSLLTRHYIVMNSYGRLGVRGYLRGLWQANHPGGTWAESDTLSGKDNLAGKSFYVFGAMNPNSSGGALIVETSNTVEFNS